MTVPHYIKWIAPTCAANTAASAYTTTTVALDRTMLWRLEVRIPPGHAGDTGLALVDSSSFLIPFDPKAAAWLIGDDDLLNYSYGKQLGNNVAIATYNTGHLAHGWQVRLEYSFMADVLAEPGPVITSVSPALLTQGPAPAASS